MRLLITTPTEVVVDEKNVEAVRAEDDSGSFGILTGHADLLTALALSVVSWRKPERPRRYCAVRHGVFSVTCGEEIAIATRQAVLGDDLDHLEAEVLAEFRNAAEAERSARTSSTQLHMRAIREIVRYLRPERQRGFGAES